MNKNVRDSLVDAPRPKRVDIDVKIKESRRDSVDRQQYNERKQNKYKKNYQSWDDIDE